MDFPAESLDDTSLSSKPLSFRPSRSLSEIDITMLPDPGDYSAPFMADYPAPSSSSLLQPLGGGAGGAGGSLYGGQDACTY